MFHNNEGDNDNKSVSALYEDLNIQELDEDDPRINQVRENITMTNASPPPPPSLHSNWRLFMRIFFLSLH